MKMDVKKIHVVLGILLLTQVGCNGGRRGQQGIYPATGTNVNDQTQPGSAFTPRNPTGLANTILGGMAPGGGGSNIQNQQETPAQRDERLRREKEAAGNKDIANNESVKKEKISWDEVELWKSHCETLGLDTEVDDENDTDGDRIPDICEDTLSSKDAIKAALAKKSSKDDANDYFMPGLNSKFYNGAFITTKRFKEGQPSLGLNVSEIKDAETYFGTTKEDKTFLQKIFGKKPNYGSEASKGLDRQVLWKFAARAQSGGNDLVGLQGLMEGDSDNDFFKAHTNSAVKGTKERYARVLGGRDEAFPYSMKETDGEFNVADLTGMLTSSITLQENQGFMYLAETNLVIKNGAELHLGQMVEKNSDMFVGKTTGIFIMTADKNTQLLSTSLLDTKENKTLGLVRSKVKLADHCLSTHVVIAYFLDEKTRKQRKQAGIKPFGETVFYKNSDDEKWKPLSQDMLSETPVGKGCDMEQKNQLFMNKIPGVKTQVEQTQAPRNEPAPQRTAEKDAAFLEQTGRVYVPGVSSEDKIYSELVVEEAAK